MALDWNKEISFSGLKKKAPKANTGFPEKTYMNLAVVDKKSFDPSKNIPLIILVVLIVALFLKFGVFDFYARVDAKAQELNVQSQALATARAAVADYDKVLTEYEGYASVNVTGDELSIGTIDALALVDRCVSPAATVSSIALKGNTLELNVTNVSLDGVGQLVSTLYQQDIVKDVSVATAATKQTASEDVSAALTITLAPVQG